MTLLWILLKTKFLGIFNYLKSNTKLIAVFIIMIFIAIFAYNVRQLKLKDKEIGRLQNNYLYYQTLNSNEKDKNRILQLTIDEFKQSKDSIIEQLKTVQKELKIKDKSLKQVQVQQQVIHLDTTIVVKQNDFNEVIRPNELTSIIICRRDSILNAKLNIHNTQSLFITSKKEYRNQYKNWFRRLIKFDFKKDINYTYQIHNSNDLLIIDKTLVIELP